MSIDQAPTDHPAAAAARVDGAVSSGRRIGGPSASAGYDDLPRAYDDIDYDDGAGFTATRWIDRGPLAVDSAPGMPPRADRPAVAGAGRWSSVRRRGPVVAVLVGAFALTLGVALPRYAYPKLAMVPLDPETVSVSQGRASTLFDRAELVQRRNVELTATVKVRGDLGAPEAAVGGDTAVWLAGTVVTDSSGVVRATTEQRVCLDRHTNVAIPDCTNQYVSNDARVDDQIRQTGQVLKFPFDTQRRDYPFFDSSTRTVAPMVFAGTDTINKLPVYRFVQSIPQTKIEDVTLPGSLVNKPDVASVEAERTFQVNRAVWIEPTSGLIIRDQQAIRQVLREPGGPDGTVALEVTLTSTPDTVRRSVTRALQARTQLQMISGTVPSALAGTGLLLLLAGLFVTVRRRRHAADWIDR